MERKRGGALKSAEDLNEIEFSDVSRGGCGKGWGNRFLYSSRSHTICSHLRILFRVVNTFRTFLLSMCLGSLAARSVLSLFHMPIKQILLELFNFKLPFHCWVHKLHITNEAGKQEAWRGTSLLILLCEIDEWTSCTRPLNIPTYSS